MKWEKNIISYLKNGNAGNCPYCKSKELEIIKTTSPIRTNYKIVCNDCGKSAFFVGTINQD